MRYLAPPLLLGLIGCGPKKEVPVIPDAVPEKTSQEKYAEVVARLPRFLDQGFIVSFTGDQKIHQGDSLLFSGLAMYALDCKSGQPIADALLKMLETLDGGAYRHPDLPSREVSLDGLLGLYRGINKRIQCGETEIWATVMKNHRSRMAASLPAEFNLVSDTLGYKLGLNDEPNMKRLHSLAVEVQAWATLVKTAKAACYRIHLGLLSLQVMEEMGYPISDEDRGGFAEATSGVPMETVDNFVGRPGLSEFLHNFSYNTWQYKPQRCQIWEGPDGYGQEHAGADFLVGYADLYGAPK